jgi:hypothetical protein
MPSQAAIASDAATDPAPLSGSKDGEAARLERHLVVLDALMEAGLRFALAIERQVTVPDAPRVVEGDIALAFHRASRAVRMTVALQARLIEEMKQPGSGPAAEPRTLRVVLVDTDGTERPLSGGRPEPAPAPLAPGHSKAEVQDVLRQVAKAGLTPGERSPREEIETAERLAREGVERLERETRVRGHHAPPGQRDRRADLPRPRPRARLATSGRRGLGAEGAGQRRGRIAADGAKDQPLGETAAATPARPPDRWPQARSP